MTIYVSMPLRGAAAPAGSDVVDGARMALAAAHGQAGELAVRTTYLDDTEGRGAAARWTQAQAGANARRATEDSSAVAYVGDFASGATRTSEAITNAARLLQVSPASTAVDLVQPFPGSNELPSAEQEGGERTFGRVIPDDEAQAVAAATWAQTLGARRVAVETDGSAYGRLLAAGFRESLRGVRVARTAQLVYFAGLREPLSALQSAHVQVMASDAVLPPFASGSAALASYATSPAEDPAQLPARGRRFVAAFERRFHRAPGPYAAYGYEAMAVVLDSIRRAGNDGTDRESVIDAFFKTRNRRSVLGTYSIAPIGNTTLNRLTGYALRPGSAPRPMALLPAR